MLYMNQYGWEPVLIQQILIGFEAFWKLDTILQVKLSKNENLVCNKNKKNISINAMLKNKILALSLEVHCRALKPWILGKVRLGSIRRGEGGGGILLKMFYMMHIFEPTLMHPEKYVLCRQFFI